MTSEEFYKELPGEDWRFKVVRKFVAELIQTESGEKIRGFCYEKRKASGDTESKLLYYIVTDKRFFEICVDSDSFGYKSYFLKHLNGFTEKIVPYCNEQNYFEKSDYFSDGNNDISSYTVEISFSVATTESEKATFSLSVSSYSSDENRIRFKKLRNFAKEFHKVVTTL